MFWILPERNRFDYDLEPHIRMRVLIETPRVREKHAHFIKKVSDFFFTFEWSSRRQRTNPFRLRTKFLIIHPTLPTLRFSLNTRHDCEIEFLLTFCIYSGLETKKTGSGNNSPAIQQPTDKRRKVASVFREDDDEGNFLRLRLLITLKL